MTPRTYERSCKSKRRYSTRQLARNARARIKGEHHGLGIYRCGFCGYYHLGKNNQPKAEPRACAGCASDCFLNDEFKCCTNCGSTLCPACFATDIETMQEICVHCLNEFREQDAYPVIETVEVTGGIL